MNSWRQIPGIPILGMSENQIETQRRQIVQLEAIPRMTKAELNTPEKEIEQIIP